MTDAVSPSAGGAAGPHAHAAVPSRYYWFAFGALVGAALTVVLLDTYGLIYRGDIVEQAEKRRADREAAEVVDGVRGEIRDADASGPDSASDRSAQNGSGSAEDASNRARVPRRPDRSAEGAHKSDEVGDGG